MSEEEITLSIRAPNSVSFSLTFSPTITVLELKEKIENLSVEASNKDEDSGLKKLGQVKKEQLRLIYSGRVLKDQDTVESYGLKNGHTMHLVKGSARSAGASTSGSGSTSDSSRPANNVPRHIEVGQQYANNPLAPLLNASNTGFGPGIAGAMQQVANPFGGNVNDPNQMLGLMDSPEFRQQMDTMLQDPAFVDMMIQNGPPEMRSMGPMLREMLRSPVYRQMLTNPDLIRQMQGMAQGGGGLPGLGGFGGFGGLGGLGGFPGGANTGATGAGAGAGGAPGNLFNQAANQQQQSASPPTTQPGTTPTGGATGTTPGLGGFGGFGGGQAGQPNLAELLRLAQAMGGGGMGGGFGGGQGAGTGLGGFPGFGGFGGGFGQPAQPADNRPPEERFEVQLGQLREMGFTNASQNIRALMANGGDVQSAIEYMLGGGGL